MEKQKSSQNFVDFNLKIIKRLKQEGILLSNTFIGFGTYSNVRIGFSHKINNQVAVKLIDIRKKSDYTQRFMPRELSIISTLSHPNIIRVHQIFQSSSFVAIIQEYGENGDLLKLIKKTTFIDEKEARFLFRQLIEAIMYLENLNIVHRDLKCENIFLDRYNNIKLGDFSFARKLTSQDICNTHCGSKPYVAVEFLCGKTYSGNAADIWSCGIILFIMLTGRMPYNDKKLQEMVHNQLNHRISFPRNMVSNEARTLIKNMIHPSREQRATTKDILLSKWLEGCKYYMRGPNEKDLISSIPATSLIKI